MILRTTRVRQQGQDEVRVHWTWSLGHHSLSLGWVSREQDQGKVGFLRPGKVALAYRSSQGRESSGTSPPACPHPGPLASPLLARFFGLDLRISGTPVTQEIEARFPKGRVFSEGIFLMDLHFSKSIPSGEVKKRKI